MHERLISFARTSAQSDLMAAKASNQCLLLLFLKAVKGMYAIASWAIIKSY